MPIDLSNLDSAPQSVISALNNKSELFERVTDISSILQDNTIRDAVVELDMIVRKEKVLAFHFTRAFREEIARDGLRARKTEEWRCLFIAKYQHLLKKEQIMRLKAGWSSYFTPTQKLGRDGRIFFNLTEKAYKDGNATSLLRYFGGEAIFKPFLADSDLNQILTSLGEPLIVRAAIDASSIKVFNSNAFGITWLSTYHHSLNPNAIKQDYDVYIEKPIHPENIISIQVVQELA